MSKRLQVVMTEAEYQEVEAAAAAARTTVSEWVRQALREARRSPAPPDSGRAIAVREQAPAYGDLVGKVMEEYGLPDEESAVRFALGRAADPPLDRDQILAMEGTGWEGNLAELRATDEPEPLP
jgi:Arc/MetJ family transcription regulator